MSPKASLLILLGTVVAIGVLFFHVVRPFIFPLLFAGILAVLFRPLFMWVRRRCGGRRRMAAALVTVAVIAMVLLPLGGFLTLAGAQLLQAGQQFVSTIDLPKNTAEAKALVDPEKRPRIAAAIQWLEGHMSEDAVKRARELASSALLGATKTLYERTSSLAGDVITFVIGMVVMVLALYYLLADGDKLAAEARRLSPLEPADEDALLDQFERVCRGVVLGTVVSALVQGALSAVGFVILGVGRIWLLAVLTMFFSFIPFLGAAAVWIFVTAGLLLQQRFGAAAFLAIYGTIVISGSDNLIKAYMIHGRTQMHPLIALVTVLGALQLVGLWGIFVGPITAAFFYALLNILHRRLYESPENAS